MKIYHLNCMTHFFGVPSITHCILIETNTELILVDTGLGIDDYKNQNLRLQLFFLSNRIAKNTKETAIQQIKQLGYSPKDLRHIILTHLHLDHCGALPDFPWAKVHVFEKEFNFALSTTRKNLLNQFGYEPRHWAHHPDWQIYQLSDETWFDIPAMKIKGINEGEFWLVPLPGHTTGHCGVAIRIENKWLLHCGDAYVRDMQIDASHAQSAFPKWARSFEQLLFPQNSIITLQNLLRDHKDQIIPFSSHDREKFYCLKNKQNEFSEAFNENTNKK